jgi:hypothetical protein
MVRKQDVKKQKSDLRQFAGTLRGLVSQSEFSRWSKEVRSSFAFRLK